MPQCLIDMNVVTERMNPVGKGEAKTKAATIAMAMSCRKEEVVDTTVVVTKIVVTTHVVTKDLDRERSDTPSQALRSRIGRYSVSGVVLERMMRSSGATADSKRSF